MHAALHGLLGKGVHPGHFYGAVQITVIDGAHFHGDIPFVQLHTCPAIAGHTLDHGNFLSILSHIGMGRQQMGQQINPPPLQSV